MMYNSNQVFEIEAFEQIYRDIQKNDEKEFLKEYQQQVRDEKLRKVSKLKRSFLKHYWIWFVSTLVVAFISTAGIFYFLKEIEVSSETTASVAVFLTALWQIVFLMQSYILNTFRSSSTGIFRFHWIAARLIRRYEEKEYSIESLKMGLGQYIRNRSSLGAIVLGAMSYLLLYLNIDNLGYVVETKPFERASDLLLPMEGPFSERWLFAISFCAICIFIFFKSYVPVSWAKQIRDYVEFIERNKNKLEPVGAGQPDNHLEKS